MINKLDNNELKHTTWLKLTLELAFAVFLFYLPTIVYPDPPADKDLDCSNPHDNVWCQTNFFDIAINPVFIAPDPKAAASASHWLNFAVIPAIAYSSALYPLTQRNMFKAHAAQDAMITTSALLASDGINALVKLIARRQRPCYHFGRENQTEAANFPGQEWVSFYSGDTTIAWTGACIAAALAYLRGRTYTRKLRAVGWVVALTGSVLRLAADMHWATDVIVGGFAGVFFGLAYSMTHSWTSAGLLQATVEKDHIYWISAWIFLNLL